MPFSFLPQNPPFASPSFGSAVAMTTAALHHSSAGNLGERERERAHLSHLYITRRRLMQSERRWRSSPLWNSSVSFVFQVLCVCFRFLILFYNGEDLVRFGPSSRYGVGTSVGPPPPPHPVTQWLLRSSFLFIHSSLPPPVLAPPVPAESVSVTAPELSGQHHHSNLWRFFFFNHRGDVRR